MKTFIKSHKKLCITLAIILALLLFCLLWFWRNIGNNLPLHKISGTIEFTSFMDSENDTQTMIYIKLDNPSVWPESEYAYAYTYEYYKAKVNVQEGDKVYIICGDAMDASEPPGLTAYLIWKK